MCQDDISSCFSWFILRRIGENTICKYTKIQNLSYLHCIIFHSYRNVFRVYSENMDSLKNLFSLFFSFSLSLVLISRIRNRKKLIFKYLF